MAYKYEDWRGRFVKLKKRIFQNNIVFICVISWILTFSVAEATKCFKNEDVGDRVENVYYCEEEDKLECCEEDNEFTCCEKQSDKTLREQLILWGTVCAVGLAIAGMCCFFWKDNLCCRDDIPLSQKCCKCCRNKSEDLKVLTPIPVSREVTSYAPRPWPSNQFQVNDFGNETPPPFSYKYPSYKQY